MIPDNKGSTLVPMDSASTVGLDIPGNTQILEGADPPGGSQDRPPSTVFEPLQDFGSTEAASSHDLDELHAATRVSFGHLTRYVERHITCPHCSNPIELLIPAHPGEVTCRSCGSRFQLTDDHEPPADSPRPHRYVGRFDVLQFLGSGGFGTVYKAYDPELDRIVALKLLRVGGMATEEQQSRFLREARNAAQLHHPAIVPVHEIGHDDGIPFIVSDYIDGSTLSEWLKHRKPSFRQTATMVLKIAEALQYAHKHGVIHRDVKPSNIMVDAAGQPYLMDFGLAKRDAGEITMTLDGEILGTPAYMSPEQARGDGHAADARSDIYSLGVVLYSLLTGELPFRGNPKMLIHQVQNDEPRAPRSLVDTIPRDLETICLKAMAKEPHRRYDSAQEFAADLGRFQSGEPILARPIGSLAKVALWARRNPRVAWLSGLVYLLLVALAAGGATGFLSVRAAQREARDQLVRLNLQNGIRLIQGGTLSSSLPWLVESLKADGRAPGRDSIHRARIESVMRGSPRPVATWSFDGPVRSAVFSPDGKRVLIASETEARILDTASGEPATQPLRGSGDAGLSPGPCRLARFGSDGSRLVTVFGREARVWDARTGDPVTPPIVHGEPVTFATLSPDGKTLVTCDGREVQLRDAADGRGPIRAFELPDLVRHAAFSPDGRYLLISFGGPEASIGAAWLWDLSVAGREPKYRLEHTDDVYHGGFSPDGTLIVTSSYEGTSRVWDARSGEPLAMRHLWAPVTESWFSPDGRKVVSVGGHQATIWDARSAAVEVLSLSHDGDVLHAEFSRDGGRVTTCGADGQARVWDAGSGLPVHPPIAHNSDVTWVSISPDGRYLLTASLDRSARMWDLSAGNWPAKVLRHGSWVSHGELSPDGGRAAVISRDGICRIWNLASGKPERALDHGHRGDYATFSPDGRFAATVGYDGAVQLWNLETGQRDGGPMAHTIVDKRRFLYPDQKIHVVRFDRRADRLLSYSAREAIVWDRGTKRRARSFQPDKDYTFTHAEFSPDGTRVVIASSDGTVRVWQSSGERPAEQVLRHAGGVLHAVFSPDGRRVLTSSADRTARIWDSATGTLIKTLAHGDQVNHGGFSPDGTMVVTSSNDRTAGIWSAETGKLLVPFLYHADAVLQACFSPDGRLVATGSGGESVGHVGEARVWDVATGDFVTMPMRHGAGVRQIAFGPDGQSLLTAAYRDGTAMIWSLSRATQPIADLEGLAMLFSAVGIDSKTGGQVSVAPSELSRLQKELAGKYPDVFASRPDEVLSWIESDALFYMEARNWEPAARSYGLLVERDPDSLHYLAQRGMALAGLGRWKEAGDDFLKAIKLGSDDLSVWYDAAILCLWNREPRRYRELCDDLLVRFGHIQDVSRSNDLAYLCAIGSETAGNIRVAVAVARRLVEARPGDSEVRTAYAAALFRAGDVAEAIRQFDESIRLNRNGGTVTDWLFLSLAEAKEGHDAEARRWLQMAEAKLGADRKAVAGKQTPVWSLPLHDEILLTEARERVRKPTP